MPAPVHTAPADLMLLLIPSANSADRCHQLPTAAQASCSFGFGSPTSQSLLTSSVFAGMLLGAASWGFLADELGRRKALMAATVVVVGAGLASSTAPTPAVSASSLNSDHGVVALLVVGGRGCSCCCVAVWFACSCCCSARLVRWCFIGCSCGLVSVAPACVLLCPQFLLLSRACVGFGLAGAPVAFTLMMELLPVKSRTLWGVLIELAWTVGTIAEAALAWAVLNTQGWRVLLLLSTGPLGEQKQP
jgi:MFS family permease